MNLYFVSFLPTLLSIGWVSIHFRGSSLKELPVCLDSQVLGHAAMDDGHSQRLQHNLFPQRCTS